MRGTLIKTAAVTSLVTALAVSAIAFYAMPKFTGQDQAAQMNPYAPYANGVTLYPAAYQAQPAFYQHPAYQPAPVYQQAPAPRVIRTAAPAQRTSSVYEPVRQRRSTGKSVLIVAGSSGAGAAIGGLTAGKKGAAIGAIAGGVAGLIYDRTTANPR